MRRTFATIAPRLRDNGWPSPIPVIKKAPIIAAWQRYNVMPVSDDEMDEWVRLFPNVNVGHAAGHGIVAVDIDVVDDGDAPKVRELADAVLGPTAFIRIGKAPKQLRLYRGASASRKAHPIEVFGTTGQVVLYGLHPVTARDYWWPEDEPLYAAPSDLPPIEELKIEHFIREVHRTIAVADQARAKATGPDRPVPEIFRDLRKQRAGRRVSDWVVDQLGAAQVGALHNTMLSVVGALVAKGYSDDEIHDLFEAHFNAPRSGEYAPVWNQIDHAIEDARRRFGVPHDMTISALAEALGIGGVK
jgi:hypothetical protein